MEPEAATWTPPRPRNPTQVQSLRSIVFSTFALIIIFFISCLKSHILFFFDCSIRMIFIYALFRNPFVFFAATTTSSDSGSEIFSNSQHFESSITFALLITIVFLQFQVSCHFFSPVSYTVFSVGQLAMSFVASLFIVIIYFEWWC